MKKLVIVDINNFIHRAYYGIQQPLKSPDGTPVNAVYGVFNMLHKLFNQLKPTHIVVAKDSRESLRKQKFPAYKENRQKTPEDLLKQKDLINEMLTLMNLPMWESSGYEADDIIHSLVKRGKKHFDEVYIASSDKDLMQLVDDKVFCIDTMKDKIYGAPDVIEKLGIHPNQVVDFLALLGDASDNIPGVSGIGEKTAIKLLKEYQSLQGILDNLDKFPLGKLKDNLIKDKEMALLSYDLALLKEPEIPDDIPHFDKDYSKLVEFFTRLNMKTLLSKI
jgi:DNA polymerase-1